MKKIRKIALAITAVLLFSTNIYSQAAFSGYSGGKLNYSSNEDSGDTYDPDLSLQAFFQGQFNFSQNMWGHLEFSIDTKDFLSKELFHKTDAWFKIDEISLIFKSKAETNANYFSLFMGTYDPIGSDIFLQRYFGIQPIASKITESWLGLAGSVLYPLSAEHGPIISTILLSSPVKIFLISSCLLLTVCFISSVSGYISLTSFGIVSFLANSIPIVILLYCNYSNYFYRQCRTSHGTAIIFAPNFSSLIK